MKYIVSGEHRFIYFVVQKVACTSIKTALLPLLDIDTAGQDLDGYEIVEREGAPNRKVRRIHRLFERSDNQISNRAFLDSLSAEYREYFKFAFVRNPWDRLVSCYSDKLGEDGEGVQLPAGLKGSVYPGMPFEEFVEAVHAIPDKKADVHFRSQHQTLCNSRGEIMADFVGRFENLREDFAYVAQRIGSSGLDLPHQMRAENRKNRPYTEFYDDRLRGLVYERFKEDIETFGYSFSPGSPHKPMKLRLPSASGSATKRQTPEQGPQQRIGKLKGRLGEQRRENETLKRENLKLQRRVRELEHQLQAIQSSRTWRALRVIGRIKARVTDKG